MGIISYMSVAESVPDFAPRGIVFAIPAGGKTIVNSRKSFLKQQ
jgi:hypothetical protein